MTKSRKKNRLETFLYKDGYVFVTINVKDHIPYFGKIENDEMILNGYWKIIEECWLRLWQQYNYIILDEYIIMPNHSHGIIIIDNDIVGNGRDRSLQQKIKWLSSIIWAFKTTSSKKLHESWLQKFQRQRSFYDHIIRNEQDFQRIREYIQINPYKWKNDEYYR